MTIFSIIISAISIILGLLMTSSTKIARLLIVLLFLLFVFENGPVDFQEYKLMYGQIGAVNGRALTYEPLYVFLSKIANSIGLSFEWYRAFVVIFELVLINNVIKRFTLNRALVLSLFLIFPACIDAELFRQLFGMCVILYGLQFLILARDKKEYFKYLVCVIIASLFHSSCWVYLMFFLLCINNSKSIAIIVFIGLIIGILTMSTDIWFKIFSYLPIRRFTLIKYDTGNYANTTGRIFAFVKQLFILSMAIIATSEMQGKIAKNNVTTNAAIMLDQKIINLNIIAFLLLIPIFYSASAQRLIHVVVIYNYLALANCYDGRRSISYIIVVISVIYSAVLLLSLLFIESTGALDAFISHFYNGYLNNALETLFHWLKI